MADEIPGTTAEVDPRSLDENVLISEFTYWFQVYRNEGKLSPDERAKFQSLVAEMKRRRLFPGS